MAELRCAAEHAHGSHDWRSVRDNSLWRCSGRVGSAGNVQPDRGAPRPGRGSDTDGRAGGVRSALRGLGISVVSARFTPSGPAVRLDVHDTAIWLAPHEAEALRIALDAAARRATAS